MNAELNRRAHAILTQAMDHEPADRRAFVMGSCADDPLVMQRVMEMLDASHLATSFLDVPVLESRGTTLPTVPEFVGKYRIVRVLGTGGMATVFEATQESPQRKVAVKVLYLSMDQVDAFSRFRFETEVLARLHHPGIAQIYEAGTAPLGLSAPCPYFAMELIPGALPITDYVKRHALTLRNCLEVFATVCDAVHHGHQHGVIHRDVKPGNVLVDQEGQPKVIDFGIARSTERNTASLTMAYGVGRLIGTLSAMSPEQCDASSEIDIRTDIYSLGVMLYRLLTDVQPYDLSRCSIPEAVRIIREVDPPPPSRLRPELAGDLDAIVTKAMEKERDQRYDSAAALASDIRRYLNDEPIEARTATAWYQLQKFVKRNRPLAAAIISAAMLLIAGISVSTWLAYVATRARSASERREHELEIVTTFQEKLLRDINVTQMGDGLRQALKESLEQTFEKGSARAIEYESVDELKRLLEQVNFTSIAVRSLQESVLQRYETSVNSQFGDQPELRARLLQQLAGTMHTLGLHAQAEPVLRQALDIRRTQLGDDHPDTLQTLHSLGSTLSTLGRFDEAHDCLQDAYDARRRVLGLHHRVTFRTGTSLGGVLRQQGKLEEAERVWASTLEGQRRVLGDDDPETLRTLNNMGIIFAQRGRLDEAETLWRELLERRRRVLGPSHPEYRGSLSNLGVLLQDRGKLTDARPLIEEALAADRRHLGDKHTNTLLTMGQLADLLRDMNELHPAEVLQRECLEGRRVTLGANHPATIRAVVGLAKILHKQHDLLNAEQLLTEVVAEPQDRSTMDTTDRIDALSALSAVLRDADQIERALSLGREALAMASASLPPDHFELGRLQSELGELLLDANLPDEANKPLHDGYAILRQSLGDDHAETQAAADRIRRWEVISPPGQPAEEPNDGTRGP